MVEGGGSQLCSEHFASSLTHLIQIFFSILTKSPINSVPYQENIQKWA